MININEKEIIEIEKIMNKIALTVKKIILINPKSNRREIFISIKTSKTSIVTKIVTTETM